MRFLAIDVETANADRASICAIGAVEFVDGQPNREWYGLVDPEDYFDDINIEIHGITERDVAGKPVFPFAVREFISLAEAGLTISHTSFDRVAIDRASSRYNLPPWPTKWLDSCRIARRAWPDRFGSAGYGLASVAKFLGIKFQHHYALEDAMAAGHIVCRAIEATGIDLEGWDQRVQQPIDPSAAKAIRLDGNPDGPFAGEKIVFTGALEIPRREAADMAAKAGFDVLPGVTKKLDVLVVGNLDARKLAGHEVSSKQRKAEELVRAGHNIQIITEADFFSLVGRS
jgi:DNA polymerase III subunit epsilon